ncbi:thermonuclease family protein [Rhizobium sp.]
MSIRLRTRLVPFILLICAAMPASGQESDSPIWTTQPTHIDRSKQTYERLPAKVAVRDTRIWIVVPERIRVLDSRSFSVGDTTYELAHIRPVKAKRLCQAVEGGRWNCGRMASIFLGNLVRGKRLLCDVTQQSKRVALANCVIGTRDVAAAIVAQGYGKAENDPTLLSTQADAQKLGAKGLWRNPTCTLDFDRC